MARKFLTHFKILYMKTITIIPTPNYRWLFVMITAVLIIISTHTFYASTPISYGNKKTLSCFKTESDGLITIKIFDILGKQVKVIQCKNPKKELQRLNLIKGTYYIEVIQDGICYTSKLSI